ncbi:hypothetical protein [Dactylosporangium sp. NPDC050588]|uniref:hypothetical protein n=1 Tax=Dactylosporangium sp. NPDC050588 TaxID=3157211 RepID=UPI0033EA0111
MIYYHGQQWTPATGQRSPQDHRQIPKSPGACQLYQHRRAAGDTYAGALRRVARRLLSGLHHCLARGELYDETLAFPPRDPDR